MSHKRTYKIQTDGPAADIDATQLTNATVQAMNAEYLADGRIEDQGVTYVITDPNIMYAWVVFDSEANCNEYFNAATAASDVSTDKAGLTILDEINETV